MLKRTKTKQLGINLISLKQIVIVRGMTAILYSLQSNNQLLYGTWEIIILTREGSCILLLSTSKRISFSRLSSATQCWGIGQFPQNG